MRQTVQQTLKTLTFCSLCRVGKSQKSVSTQGRIRKKMIALHVAPQFALVFCIFFTVEISAKVYTRCELAKELVEKHEVPKQQVATWVCIAEHESEFNTSAVGQKNWDGSRDHGLFQISDQYWCSPPGNGWACGVTCAELEDDDISDDYICARRIYREHKQLSGDGFSAWAVYHSHCARLDVKYYIKGCFDEGDDGEKAASTRKLNNFLDRLRKNSLIKESNT